MHMDKKDIALLSTATIGVVGGIMSIISSVKNKKKIKNLQTFVDMQSDYIDALEMYTDDDDYDDEEEFDDDDFYDEEFYDENDNYFVRGFIDMRHGNIVVPSPIGEDGVDHYCVKLDDYTKFVKEKGCII